MNKKELLRENQELKKIIERVEKELARAHDIRTMIEAGIPVKGIKGIEELAKTFAQLSILRANLFLRIRVVQLNASIEEEAKKLQEEIDKLTNALQEPLVLELLYPKGGEKISQGETLEIRWEATGAIGERLNITLFVKGMPYRELAKNVKTANKGFSWQVPKDFFPADDFQIGINDPATGKTSFSGFFSIVPSRGG